MFKLLQQRRERILTFYPLLISSLFVLAFYVYFSTNYFFGDDLELIAESIRGVSLFQPISTHIRPVVRLHFLLIHIAGMDPVIFHLLSLLLHIMASFSLFLFLKTLYRSEVALFTALLFFSSFRLDEAVFWGSSAGGIYCFSFVFLSLYFYNKNRYSLALLFMFLSLLSYELWVVLPFAFLLFRREKWLTYLSFFLILPYFLMENSVSGSLLNSYGGFSMKQLPLRFSIYIFRLFSPFGRLPGGEFFIALSLAVVFFLIYTLKEDKKLAFPAILFSISALVLSFSKVVPSRFYYFPVAGIFVLLSLGVFSIRKKLRVIARVLVFYLIILNPILVYLDGQDYRMYSRIHRAIIENGKEAFSQVKAGERVRFLIGKFPDFPRLFTYRIRGTVKLFFKRPDSIGGIMYPEDLVTLLLWSMGLIQETIPCKENLIEKEIRLGREPPFISYCFIVLKK